MIILDSSFLIALKIENDVHHEAAARIMKEIAGYKYGKPVITDYIFDETVTGIFAKSKRLKLAIEFGNEILNSLEIFDVNDKIFSNAWETFQNQKNTDTDFSFTDSTIIAVMKENQIRNIASFDNDFTKIKDFNVILS